MRIVRLHIVSRKNNKSSTLWGVPVCQGRRSESHEARLESPTENVRIASSVVLACTSAFRLFAHRFNLMLPDPQHRIHNFLLRLNVRGYMVVATQNQSLHKRHGNMTRRRRSLGLESLCCRHMVVVRKRSQITNLEVYSTSSVRRLPGVSIAGHQWLVWSHGWYGLQSEKILLRCLYVSLITENLPNRFPCASSTDCSTAVNALHAAAPIIN